MLAHLINRDVAIAPSFMPRNRSAYTSRTCCVRSLAGYPHAVSGDAAIGAAGSESVRVYGDLSSATLQPAHPDSLQIAEHAEHRIGDLSANSSEHCARCRLERNDDAPLTHAQRIVAARTPRAAAARTGGCKLWRRFLH
jgi:hypothetical protein